MSPRVKSMVLSLGLLGLMGTAAAAFPAQVVSNAHLRWGPSTEFPIQVTIPAGSTVDVGQCSTEWCSATWADYEGFIYRPLLAFGGGVTVPYIAVFPDYEYYNGYYYGPSFAFRYYGPYHSRAYSRAIHHSRAESRAMHHSRPESKASHSSRESRVDTHSLSESIAVHERRGSRDGYSPMESRTKGGERRDVVPEALRRQRELQQRENRQKQIQERQLRQKQQVDERRSRSRQIQQQQIQQKQIQQKQIQPRRVQQQRIQQPQVQRRIQQPQVRRRIQQPQIQQRQFQSRPQVQMRSQQPSSTNFQRGQSQQRRDWQQ